MLFSCIAYLCHKRAQNNRKAAEYTAKIAGFEEIEVGKLCVWLIVVKLKEFLQRFMFISFPYLLTFLVPEDFTESDQRKGNNHYKLFPKSLNKQWK